MDLRSFNKYGGTYFTLWWTLHGWTWLGICPPGTRQSRAEEGQHTGVLPGNFRNGMNRNVVFWCKNLLNPQLLVSSQAFSILSEDAWCCAAGSGQRQEQPCVCVPGSSLLASLSGELRQAPRSRRDFCLFFPATWCFLSVVRPLVTQSSVLHAPFFWVLELLLQDRMKIIVWEKREGVLSQVRSGRRFPR